MTYPLPPSAVDITFDSPATQLPLNAVDLTFGATSGPPPGTVYVAALSGKFALRAAVSVNYDINQWRGLSTATVVPHQQATSRMGSSAARWQPSAKGLLVADLPYQEALDANVGVDSAWGLSEAGLGSSTLAWGATGRAVDNTATSGWDRPPASTRSATLPWEKAGQSSRTTGIRYGLAKATPRSAVAPWDTAKSHQNAVTSRMNQAAKATRHFAVVPWQRALVVASYGGPQYLPPPRVAPPVRPDTVIDLRFCALYADLDPTTLVFGLNPCGGITPDSLLYILPARFYMAVHTIEAHLLPSNTAIPIFDVSLGADTGSFAWTFSASGPASLFDALAPTSGVPVQIRITLDGMPWVFVVDSLQLQEQFGGRSTRISGRSASALIGDPFQRQTFRLNSTAQNAQQLALAALNLTGVDLDWGITDWLVPAGAWSHQGTPLAAVQALAEAAGGYVNSHRSDPTLLVRHPYPLLPGGIPGGPWNWDGAFAADVELAPDSIITSSIDRRDGPDVDGVYVVGTNQGVFAKVRRAGTSGNKLAQMVTDPLITANAAASQRGLSIIGPAGAKHMVQISLPVLTGASQPGVLDVGQLVQVNENTPWRGRVRSVSVQAAMPSVRQTITLERHL